MEAGAPEANWVAAYQQLELDILEYRKTKSVKPAKPSTSIGIMAPTEGTNFICAFCWTSLDGKIFLEAPEIPNWVEAHQQLELDFLEYEKTKSLTPAEPSTSRETVRAEPDEIIGTHGWTSLVEYIMAEMPESEITSWAETCQQLEVDIRQSEKTKSLTPAEPSTSTETVPTNAEEVIGTHELTSLDGKIVAETPEITSRDDEAGEELGWTVVKYKKKKSPKPATPSTSTETVPSKATEIIGTKTFGRVTIFDGKHLVEKEIIAKDVKGVVFRFDEKKGYGFIRRPHTYKNVFFHKSELKKCQNLIHPVGPGAQVEFDIVSVPKGLMAVNLRFTPVNEI